MQKKPLIGVSICAVVLVVLASLTNVVGYQTVQSSNQKIINTEINQKELLFQTILDIANNKEIQKVIIGSEITSKRFFNPGLRFSTFSFPVITEKILKRMYAISVILFGALSKSKIQSMIKQYQVNNQGMQKELNTVIEKNPTLKGEVTQVSSLSCDCNNENTEVWHFPIICTLLFPLFTIFDYIAQQIPGINIFYFLAFFISVYGQLLHCFWY